MNTCVHEWYVHADVCMWFAYFFSGTVTFLFFNIYFLVSKTLLMHSTIFFVGIILDNTCNFYRVEGRVMQFEVCMVGGLF